MNTYPYSCRETCGQDNHCGNRYCSAHPHHHSFMAKINPNSKKERTTPFQRKYRRPFTPRTNSPKFD